MLSFQEFLHEKWVANWYTSQYPIYENPGSSDLVDLRKTGLSHDVVRFIAIKSSKKIYVWNGMAFIHTNAREILVNSKILPSSLSTQNLDDMLCGECHLKAGRLTFAGNDGMDTYFGDVIDVIVNKEKFVKGEEYFFPLPYTSPFELIKNVDKILKDYQFVSSFIDDYETESSPALLKKAYKNYK